MIELQILHAFCEEKNKYISYRTYFDSILSNVERELKLIYILIGEYYEKYPDTNTITNDELFAFYKYKYPVSKDASMLQELMLNIFETTLQKSLLTDLLEQLKERYFATKIVNKLLPVVEGIKYGVFPDLKSEIDSFTTTQETKVSDGMSPCIMSVGELIQETILRDGLSWHLEGLTDIVGTIPIKSLGGVFGFVNASKTSFCIAAGYNFAEQFTNPTDTLVYAGNEEPAERILLRFTQTATGMSSDGLMDNPDKADELLHDSAMKQIMVYDSVINIDQVEYLLQKHTPRILIIDQGTKVAIKSEEKDVVQKQHLYNIYRTFATKYNTSILTVSQGDANSANKKWLELKDMYSSKVAIQGELDYAFGIGFIEDDKSKERLRYINISKNKGPMGKVISHFNKEINKWKSL